MEHVRPGRRRRARSVGAEVTSAFRVMIAGMAAIILFTSTTTVWLEYYYNPRVADLSRAVESIEGTHVAMIDAETSLRAYLFAKQDRFLLPYVNAKPVMDASLAALDEIDFESPLERDAVAFRLARQAWWDQWAGRAFEVAFSEPSEAEVTAFLDEGRTLFETYREAEQTFVTNARAELDESTQRQSLALALLLMTLIVISTAVVLITLRRRRRLRGQVVRPVVQLRATIDQIAAGDLRPPPEVDASLELVALRDGVARMTEALADERQAAIDRQARTDEMATRLQEVVAFARDMSGSLSLHHVLSAVGEAVRTTAEAASVRVWLMDVGDEHLFLAHDTDDGADGQVSAEVRPTDEGILGRAVRAGEPLLERLDGLARSAWPMVVGARVTGVVEVVDPRRRSSPEQFAHVQALIRHAAAAIEAARLHQQTAWLSTQDGLTGLANRRRFDDDLQRETDLALRHGRMLAFVMLDLDHFKNVNDTYGHQRGDQVLKEVGAVLLNEARATDSVYRYGGEEFAVLVQEADAATAAAVAERMRSAIEDHFRRAGGSTQTVSCGVASMPEHASTGEGLVAAADAALYVAKQTGRNRVAVAGSGVAEVTIPG